MMKRVYKIIAVGVALCGSFYFSLQHMQRISEEDMFYAAPEVTDGMRLFLASSGISPHEKHLVALAKKGARAVIIPNAQDPYVGNEPYNTWHVEQLNALGFEAEILDLRLFFGKEAELRMRMKPVNLVWATGGNTFVLRRAMAQSGFDKILYEKIKAEDDFVYGGSSAGASVVTPTLKGIDLFDDPYNIPEGYDKAVIWQGLGLVDYCIIPHYNDEPPAFFRPITIAENRLKDNGLSYRGLRDGEVILVGD